MWLGSVDKWLDLTRKWNYCLVQTAVQVSLLPATLVVYDIDRLVPVEDRLPDPLAKPMLPSCW